MTDESISLIEEDLDLLAASTLGDNIERMARDKASPLGLLLRKSRTEYTNALTALIHSDLYSETGLREARSLQAHALRHKDMCSWLIEGLEAAGEADGKLSEEVEEEAVEELKEMIHGKRDKPAPDA